MTVEDIALVLTPGLGAKGVVGLLNIFVSAEKIFSASRAELIHFAQLNPKIADAIAGRVSFAQARDELEYCRKNGITPIASTDSVFPPMLLHAEDYPHVLYVKGNLDALTRRGVSIVGTRKISAYGERMCHEIVRDLSTQVSDLSIISGLAFGVDSAAHRAALAYGVPTVAVIANALPAITPSSHTALAADIIDHGGAIVTECHSQTKYMKSLYIMRNRIVAAMSHAIIVAESPLSGGSMVTANIADGYSRPVMAVPGRVSDKNSEGCNKLIASNIAHIYTTAEQFVRDMMWDTLFAANQSINEPQYSKFSPQQQQLISCFSSGDPLSVEELSLLSKFNISELLVMLMELEMDGVVKMMNGRYILLSVAAK